MMQHEDYAKLLCEIKRMKDMNEFPKTLQAAINHFADPDVALNFMASIRWPNGVECPRCGSDKV